LVDDREQVAVERAEHVLRPHADALARRLDACAHVRHAVHLEQAVRAAALAAEQAARAVVREAAREDAASVREEGGAAPVAWERELVDVAQAAVGARDEEAQTPGIHSVPASGTRAIAAASIVRATRSSGSRLWTCDLPQARASVCASSVITRR